MAELAIVAVATFFGLITLMVTYAWVVLPVLVGAWLLLLVPPTTWRRMRAKLSLKVDDARDTLARRSHRTKSAAHA